MFGYNPQTPGRPSHCYHAFCIAKLRLVLCVVVHAGNETAGVYSAEMRDKFLIWLSGRLRLKLVTVNDDMYADGYEWYALVTDLDLDPRAVSKLYRERGGSESHADRS